MCPHIIFAGNDVSAGDEPNEYLYGVGFASEAGGLDIRNTRDKRYIDNQIDGWIYT